jgi:hypothetical protein
MRRIVSVMCLQIPEKNGGRAHRAGRVFPAVPEAGTGMLRALPPSTDLRSKTNSPFHQLMGAELRDFAAENRNYLRARRFFARFALLCTSNKKPIWYVYAPREALSLGEKRPGGRQIVHNGNHSG